MINKSIMTLTMPNLYHVCEECNNLYEDDLYMGDDCYKSQICDKYLYLIVFIW
jgi:hypothetical protein